MLFWGLYTTKTIQITKINKGCKLLQGKNGKKSTNEEQKSTKIRRAANLMQTPSTLMPTGIGVANPKFIKSGRKFKKAKHCTILETLINDEK